MSDKVEIPDEAARLLAEKIVSQQVGLWKQYTPETQELLIENAVPFAREGLEAVYPLLPSRATAGPTGAIGRCRCPALGTSRCCFEWNADSLRLRPEVAIGHRAPDSPAECRARSPDGETSRDLQPSSRGSADRYEGLA